MTLTFNDVAKRRNASRIDKLEIKARTGENTWEAEWTDITEYYVRRQGDIQASIDSKSMQGRIEQASCNFLLNNKSGRFNPPNSELSYWYQTNKYPVFSRVRLWEGFEINGVQYYDDYPSIDGLIASAPKYPGNFVAKIEIHSILAILSTRYILENFLGRTKRLSAYGILRRIAEIYRTEYAELEVNPLGGIMYNDVTFDNITPYDKSMLQLYYDIISNGGGIGGLRRDNTLISSWMGAETAGTGSLLGGDIAHSVGSFTEMNNYDNAIEGSFDSFAISNTMYPGPHVQSFDGSRIWVSVPEPHYIPSAFGGLAWRNFYRPFHAIGGAYSHNSYELAMVFYYDFNLMPVFGVQWGTSLAVWTSNQSDNPELGSFEGFIVNNKQQLCYEKWTGSGASNITVLADLNGESYWQLLNLFVDHDNNEITVGLNGVIVSRVRFDAGFLNTITKNKLVFFGDWFLEDNGPEVEYLNRIYFDQFRLSQGIPGDMAERSKQDAISVFGSVNPFPSDVYIYDNYERNNLLDILSYDPGDRFVKNHIIFAGNSADDGYNMFSYEGQLPGKVVGEKADEQPIEIRIGTTSYMITTRTIYSLAKYINDTAAIASKLRASIEQIQGRDWIKIITVDPDLDMRDVTIRLRVGVAQQTGSPPPDPTPIECLVLAGDVILVNRRYLPVADRYLIQIYKVFSLIPYGDNQSVYATDSESVLNYGRKIKRIPDTPLFTEPETKQRVLENHLFTDKDPKARMTVKVPFMEGSPDIMKQVEIRISPQDVNNGIPGIRAFIEGGHFESWQENDFPAYRWKRFYISGYRHPDNKQYSMLELIEKPS